MSDEVLQFDDFELDRSAYGLRRAGRAVRLERIPLDLLFLLSDRRGHLVTREEIVAQIWGPDVFVDVDNSINTAVRKIRRALRDNPDRPRYLHTIPGKGYRFAPPVKGPSAVEPETAPPVLARDPASRRVSGGPPSMFVSHRSARKRLLWAAIAIVCLAILVQILARPRPSFPVSGFRRISNDGSGKRGPLATDGLRVYFAEGSVNSASVDQVSVSGGETAPVPTPFGLPRLLDISPSRSELLLSSVIDVGAPSPLWLLPLPAGPPRRLGDVLADDATWSPDGQDISYVRGNIVYRAKKDGSDARALVTLPGTPSWLRWSPDGTRLRLTLTNTETGLSALWEVSADGQRSYPLLPGWNRVPAECCGSWTGDGKSFLFESTQNDKTDVWMIQERRGLLGLPVSSVYSPARVTAGQLNSLAPMPSPDSKTVYVIGEQLRGELLRYEAHSGQFIPYLSGISAEFVDFSSDGQWVAYVAFPEGTLWRSKTDGTERLQLTFPSARVTAPRWSPDNRRIAFFDAAQGKPWRMYVVSADGGTAAPPLEETHNQMDPNWSPDGGRLAFSYFPLFETSAPEVIAVYVFEFKTRTVTKLPGSNGLWAPRWSRDGRYIVARTSSGAPRLMLFDFQTRTWAELIKDTAGWANWSRDGHYIYYLRRGSEPAILRIRLSDRTVEQVVSLKGLRQTGFRAGVWTGLAPDDSPLLLRDTGSREIYALDWQPR